MTSLFTRLTLAAAMALPLAAQRAAAQTADDIKLMNASLASVLAVCVGAFDGKVDLNDRAALAEYGIAPVAAEQEVRLRQRVPGIEYAGVILASGSVSVGYLPGAYCTVQIDATTSPAIRDELVKELTDTGVRTAANGGDRLFYFSTYTMLVRLAPSQLMVSIRRPQ